MNVLGVFGCLMEATTEAMLPHTWFEMEFVVIIGSSFFFSRLFLQVYSYTAVGVSVLDLVFLAFYLLALLAFLKKKIICLLAFKM